MNGSPPLPSRLRAQLSAQVGRLALDVELDTAGGTLALVGPNGAGKSTTLALLLGILASRGRIAVKDEQEETVLLDSDAGIDVPVEQRRLGYVPQDYALFPHLSVRDNVAFAMKSAHRGGPWDPSRVDGVLDELGISWLAARFPHTLSGGEKQRVALARALSVRPRALLLDEPLAALDVPSRREVRTYLARTLRSLALPAVVVTHDPLDARALARRIVVLEGGKVTQAGTWEELEARPASSFVEGFVAELEG